MCPIDSLFSNCSSRLLYSILYGLPDNSLHRLQKIQNTAARILALSPRFSHISATFFTCTGYQLGTESRLEFVF